jgi:hypothetical protein
MTIHVTPIPRLIDLAAPAFTLGTANTAGSAETAVASDSTLLAFDTTVPTTIAYGASAAVGSAVVTSRRDHTHGMAAEPTVGVTRIGGQTSVSSTTSTSVVDLISIGSLTVAANDPIKIVLTTGKSTGAASACAFGLKLNTTVCVLAVAGGTSLIGHDSNNEMQMGYGVYEIAPRIGNYQMLVGYQFVSSGTTVTRSKSVGPVGNLNAFPPVATITDIVITAISTSSVTASCGLLEIYNFAG